MKKKINFKSDIEFDFDGLVATDPFEWKTYLEVVGSVSEDKLRGGYIGIVSGFVSRLISENASSKHGVVGSYSVSTTYRMNDGTKALTLSDINEGSYIVRFQEKDSSSEGFVLSLKDILNQICISEMVKVPEDEFINLVKKSVDDKTYRSDNTSFTYFSLPKNRYAFTFQAGEITAKTITLPGFDVNKIKVFKQ